MNQVRIPFWKDLWGNCKTFSDLLNTNIQYLNNPPECEPNRYQETDKNIRDKLIKFCTTKCFPISWQIGDENKREWLLFLIHKDREFELAELEVMSMVVMWTTPKKIVKSENNKTDLIHYLAVDKSNPEFVMRAGLDYPTFLCEDAMIVNKLKQEIINDYYCVFVMDQEWDRKEFLLDTIVNTFKFTQNNNDQLNVIGSNVQDILEKHVTGPIKKYFDLDKSL